MENTEKTKVFFWPKIGSAFEHNTGISVLMPEDFRPEDLTVLFYPETSFKKTKLGKRTVLLKPVHGWASNTYYTLHLRWRRADGSCNTSRYFFYCSKPYHRAKSAPPETDSVPACFQP